MVETGLTQALPRVLGSNQLFQITDHRSALLVEKRRIELRYPDCKTGALPLSYNPIEIKWTWCECR